MAAFGSFAILLGLVLCVYNFVVGAFALRQIASIHVPALAQNVWRNQLDALESEAFLR